MNDVFLPNVWNVSFDILTINAPISIAWISYDVAVKYLPFVFVFWLVEERGKREKKMENFKIFDVFLIEALPYCSKEDRGDVSGHQSPSHKWWMCVKSYEEEKYVTNQICLECPPPNFSAAHFSKKVRNHYKGRGPSATLDSRYTQILLHNHIRLTYH